MPPLFSHFKKIRPLISSAGSFGFSIEAYLKSKSRKDVTLTNAKYAVSRSFSLFFVSIGLFIFISDSYLITLSVVMIMVQLFDGIIGIKINRRFRLYGGK
jgi:hypothetical protein